MCLSVFVVNVDTLLVNVTLPTLVRELGATTRELQWIVDAYLLAFAALVLAGGSLSDRLGRRRVLVLGLTVFALGNALAGLCDTSGQLVAARALTGVGAAAVFPSTLSIITHVHPERAARARAIGIWGATGGLAVAFGPITGGALLQSFDWGATFLVKVPVALLAVVLAVAFVPESRSGGLGRMDLAGLALSATGLATLVYTIIEAPGRGWLSAPTLGWAAVATLLFVAFAARERRAPEPLLDLALFRDRRFTAASLAVTVAFFALFGFIFLITQYFQFLRGYGPLESGLRILPVATCVAVGSVAGTWLAVRIGNTMVVSGGLLCLTVAYAWISQVSLATSYSEIVVQMVFLGLGMGLTSAPATESIMGAVSARSAGIGSAVNDATREIGGTLGVAVLGSVFASLYATRLDEAAASLPAGVAERSTESFGAALAIARLLPAAGADALRAAADRGFFDGLQASCLVAAGVAFAGAVFTALTLPARPRTPEQDLRDQPDPPSTTGAVTHARALDSQAP
jgi:EmrB/QacA subfamily drug resistance transporter